MRVNRELRLSSLSLAVICFTGLIITYRLRPEGIPATDGVSLRAATYLFLYNEPPLLVLSLVFLAGCFWWTLRIPASDISWGKRPRLPDLPAASEDACPTEKGNARGWLGVWLLALAVLVFTGIGTFVVYHDYPLAMDEYLVRWPAPLFLEGRVTAAVAS